MRAIKIKSFLPELVLGVLLLPSLLLLWQARSAYQIAQAAEPREIAPVEFFTRFSAAPANYQVVDLRSRESFEKGHIPVALHVPLEGLSDPATVATLDQWKSTLIVSEDGDAQAFLAVAAHFKKPKNLVGGMRAWRIRGLVSVPGPPGAKTTLA
jgi:rhodanese-related sulfurtransferase